MAYDFTATKGINTKPLASTPYTLSLLDTEPEMEQAYNSGNGTTTTTSSPAPSGSGSCNCMNNTMPKQTIKFMDIMIIVGILVAAALLTGFFIKKMKA